jgi:hypothetical protein
MTKAHKPGSQKPGPDKTKATGAKKPDAGASSSPKGTSQSKPQPGPSITFQTDTAKGKQSGKGPKSTIGGTAAPGAKSMQPKEIAATSPTQQQAESYNRETRRRMQHMGMGPYGESPTDSVRSRRQKRVEKRKQRQEEVKKTVVTKGPSTNIKLGRRNTYFLLGMIAFLLLIIILAIIIRHPF